MRNSRILWSHHRILLNAFSLFLLLASLLPNLHTLAWHKSKFLQRCIFQFSLWKFTATSEGSIHASSILFCEICNDLNIYQLGAFHELNFSCLLAGMLLELPLMTIIWVMGKSSLISGNRVNYEVESF